MHGEQLDAPLTTAAAIDAGHWLAGGVRTGRKARRVHFYPDGEDLSICMRAHSRPPTPLIFDPDSGRTEVDPKLGEPQYRAPCTLCTVLLAEDAGVEGLPAAALPGMTLPWTLGLEREAAYPIRITRAMGTRDGVARFAVVDGLTSGWHLQVAIGLFTATAEMVAFVPVPSGAGAAAGVEGAG